MAISENYCLRLNEFDRNVKKSWQEFQVKGDFCDMTLACEDKVIKTHKLIISSFSSVLRNILKLNQTPHPLIYLQRVRYTDLQNLLNFMYQGEVNVAEEDLSRFLEVAEDLNVKGLAQRNIKVCDSIEKTSSQYNVTSSRKEKGKIKNEPVDNNHFADTSTEFVKEIENLISIDQDRNNFPENNRSVDTSAYTTMENDKQYMSVLTGKKLSCGKCDKLFSGKSGLYQHNKSVHEGVQYSCDKCEFKGMHKSHLKYHVKSIHEGERHLCELCDQKAATKQSLREHVLRMHKQ